MPARSFLGVVLSTAIAYQPALAAPPTLGQAIIKGQAKINDVVTRSGTSLFAGDRVATSTNSIAELQLTKGGNVFLPASSVVVLEQKGDHEKSYVVYYWASLNIHSSDIEASEDGILNALRSRIVANGAN